MTIPASELAAWSELADKATPGPWCSVETRHQDCSRTRSMRSVSEDTVFSSNGRYFGSKAPSDADAAFIAASRTALPRLVAALAQSQARVAELEKAIEKHRESFSTSADEGIADDELWSVLPQSKGAT